jgi:WD40 repeat protein
MAVSIDGDQILTGCEDGTTTLWDTATGKPVHNFQGHTKQVTEVALSAYGQFAWSASDDGTARLWDIKSGKEVKSVVIPGAGSDTPDLPWHRPGRLAFAHRLFQRLE